MQFSKFAAVIAFGSAALADVVHHGDARDVSSILPLEDTLPSTSEHGLGLLPDPPIQTNGPIPDPIDRSKVFRSYDTPPVLRPGDGPPWAPGDDDSSKIKRGKKEKFPRKLDWRHKWGENWITSIQDQGQCGSCWAFAMSALIEATTRIQHGFWDKRSEADFFESSQRTCKTGWDYDPAFKYIMKGGISDEMCNIYYDQDRPYLGCGDRSGRALQIGDYYPLETKADEKWWLNNVGPITCALDVYEDFQKWNESSPKVYHHVRGSSELQGGHALLIVGYNDDEKYWIVKNSWGAKWGNAGYINVGYGEVRIDDWRNNTKYGVTNLDPDQWPRRRHRNGNLLQSSRGKTHRDFAGPRTGPNHTILWLLRGGESEGWSVDGYQQSWKLPDGHPNRYAASNGPPTGQPCVVETSFSNRTNDFVYWVKKTGTFAHWYYSRADRVALQTYPGGTNEKEFKERGHGNVTGYPGFIETDDSNFTVVVKGIDNDQSSLVEYIRYSKSGPFVDVRYVTPSGVLQSGPSLIQSNIGLNLSDPNSAGNLYVAAVMKTGKIQIFWRGASENHLEQWHAGEVIDERIPDTPPVMIQDFWNTEYEYSIGGFQLLVAVDGYVNHWQRLNDDIIDHPPVEGEQGRWEALEGFGEGDIKHVWGLVQGSFNFALEAIVEDYGGDLWHWEYTGKWAKGDKLPSVWEKGQEPEDEKTEKKLVETTSKGECDFWCKIGKHKGSENDEDW